MAWDWETLQKGYTIKTHALVSQIFSKMALDFITPPLTQLRHAHAIFM